MTSASRAYLLLVRDTTPEVYDTMSTDERRQALFRWNNWVDKMAATGKLQSGNPLGDDRRVITGRRGTNVVDGPFSEAKELVGGYFLLDDITLEDATAIAQQCPLLEYGMSVEIRPIAPACHLALDLGFETMRGPTVG